MDEKLDLLLNLFYDGDLLHFKKISGIDLFIRSEQKFNLDFTIEELNFLMDILISDGYVKSDLNKDSVYEFSITTNGIILKESGGFQKKAKIEKSKQRLIYWSSVAVIIAGIYYLLESLLTIKVIIKMFTDH